MNMMAVIIQDNLEDPTPNNIFKPLFLCASGLLIYISTGSFVGNSFIWLSDPEQHAIQNATHKRELMFKKFSGVQEEYSWKLQTMYFIRALLAFFAQVEHQLGAWEIFDSYIVQPHIYRDIAYLFIGLIGLQWSKALLMNACVTPFNVPVKPDGLMGAKYNHSPHHNHPKNVTKRRRISSTPNDNDNDNNHVDVEFAIGTTEDTTSESEDNVENDVEMQEEDKSEDPDVTIEMKEDKVTRDPSYDNENENDNEIVPIIEKEEK